MVTLANSYPFLNTFRVSIDPMVVIRWTDIAIASDSNGGASPCARNPGSHEVDVRAAFRTGGSRIGSQRETTGQQLRCRGLGKSLYLVGVRTRAPCARGIVNHLVRCRTEAPPC